MTNDFSKYLTPVKALIVTAATVLGLGLGIANAQTQGHTAPTQQSAPSQTNWLAGGGG